jgi:hypothetical protein
MIVAEATETCWWILTYLLTPWSRVLLETLTGFASIQEIPRLYGTRKLITVFTSVRPLSLSWARSIQSPQSPPTSWRSLLILSFHLHLGLPNGLLPSGLPTNTVCTPLPSPIYIIFISYSQNKFSYLASKECYCTHPSVSVGALFQVLPIKNAPILDLLHHPPPPRLKYLLMFPFFIFAETLC